MAFDVEGDLTTSVTELVSSKQKLFECCLNVMKANKAIQQKIYRENSWSRDDGNDA